MSKSTTAGNLSDELDWYFDLFEHGEGINSPIHEVSMTLTGIKWDDTGMLTGADHPTDGFEQTMEEMWETIETLRDGDWPKSHERHPLRCYDLLEKACGAAIEHRTYRKQRDQGIHPYSKGITSRTYGLSDIESEDDVAVCYVEFSIPTFGSAGIRWSDWGVRYGDSSQDVHGSLVDEEYDRAV